MSSLYCNTARSFAEQYPNVPQPDDPASPTVIAAQWRSHAIYGEDLPAIAADLLERGFDTPSLRRLAGEMNITHSADAEPLVAAAFRELGIDYPLSERQANLVTSRQIAREVIHGRRNAWAAASHLEIAVWNWQTSNARLQVIGEIGQINDEVNWDRGYGRSLEGLEDALITAFARLAVLDV